MYDLYSAVNFCPSDSLACCACDMIGDGVLSLVGIGVMIGDTGCDSGSGSVGVSFSSSSFFFFFFFFFGWGCCGYVSNSGSIFKNTSKPKLTSIFGLPFLTSLDI